MLIDSKGFTSDARLIDLKESIFGNNTTISWNNGTLMYVNHCEKNDSSDLLLRPGGYHQERLQEPQFLAIFRHEEQ